MKPIVIDLSGLRAQFGLASNQIDDLTEICVNAVTAAIYNNWISLAKQELKSTSYGYINGLIKVDKGKLAKQIVLTGTLPNMLEQGTSAYDLKEGFKKSNKVKYTVPVYGKNGKTLYKGGDWYFTVPFRIGVPGTLGQAGFTGQLPQEVYSVILKKSSKSALTLSEIPSPYDEKRTRQAILDEKGQELYAAYTHKNSIYEGLTKRKAEYEKVSQNTYGTFRRAGANSDPMSWIHKGFKKYDLAQKAIDQTDIETIVNNEVVDYLETAL